MRLIEGTVEEILEYQRQVGEVGPKASSGNGGEDLPTGKEPRAARTVTGTLEDEDDEDAFFIRQFVYARSSSPAIARRVFEYLAKVATKGTIVEVGESERTEDGYTNYLMVRDDGPRRFGAVAYVKPSNGGLTMRLRPEDVADLDDDHVKQRNVAPSQQYAINCPLNDDDAVAVALTLTERALSKVRVQE